MSWLLSTREGRQFLIGGVGCLAGALLLLRYVVKTTRRARASATWPSAPGVVRKSEKIQFVRSSMPSVEYSYTVGSEVYFSKRISLVSISGTGESWVDRILEAYPEGKRVEVFYDPERPSYGVLKRGPLDKRDWRFMWFLIVAMTAGGVINLYYAGDAVLRHVRSG